MTPSSSPPADEPSWYALLDPDRPSDVVAPVDFEAAGAGGRGESYRAAQHDPCVRASGIAGLFRLASPGRDLASWRPHHVVLDVLGGDGTLARAISQILPVHARPAVLTSDISAGMVRAAQRHGLPAVRQAAQALRVRDGVLDAVLLAYGTHHIPVAERAAAVREAWRVLRPGGRLVVHDFAEGSPAARWFAEVVDVHSRTPHRYPHFTPDGLRGLLASAGFAEVEVGPLYDPFVLTARGPGAARHALGRHLKQMYGLRRISDAEVTRLAALCFRYPGDSPSGVTVSRVDGGWRIELPRVALVAVGRRVAP